jgi:hypothetical protein
MALVSPGVEVTVTNESAYVTSDPGTVPLILVATAQDKLQASGSGTASGTTAANAGKVQLLTSQLELATTFGTPNFYSSTSGTMLHGYELNEYGLQAAYSYLGIANQAYVLRADVDLSKLTGSATAPTGTPVNGTHWLDLTNTVWGLHVWNATTQTFTYTVPTICATEHSGSPSYLPNASFGSIGDYTVVTATTNNAIYYKTTSNTWVAVGSGAITSSAHALATRNASWASSFPTISVTPSAVTIGHEFSINGSTVTFTGTGVDDIVSDINGVFTGGSAAITGVQAYNNSGVLEIYVIGSSASDGATASASAAFANVSGTALADMGITAGTFNAPRLQESGYTTVPTWQTGAATPAPSGSMWVKLDGYLGGANGNNIVVKVYSSTSGLWESKTVYAYDSITDATTGRGGTDPRTIAVGTLIVDHDVASADEVTFKPYRRKSSGELAVTGSNTSPTFVNLETFTINGTTVTLGGTAASDFLTAVSGAAITDVSARVETSGAVTLVHAKGDDLVLRETSGTPLADAGISASLANVYTLPNGDLIGTNWEELTYEASATVPTSDPAAGDLWYDTTLVADIMVHDGTTWKGYQNVSTDYRGYDLSQTDPAGPIFAAAEPLTQSDATALVNGDLWIDTSDLENYPKLYRYQSSAWVLIDGTDQTSSNGILFADARWQTAAAAKVSGSGAGTASSIADLLSDDFLDPDAPDPASYPRGMMLWNTRRSGYTVKEYRADEVTVAKYSSGNPRMSSESVATYYPDRWANKSGTNSNGSLSAGRKSQRAVVVAAMKSAVDANTDIREEQRQFNLIAAPGYPELLSNMTTLNVDRKETAHVIGDAPFRLSDNAANIQAWSKNSAAAEDNGEDGLVTNNEYMSVYYPSGFANDLAGNSVVVPASHMILRTFAYNDSVGYPWFAAAGTNRGKVSNATAIGYIDSVGEFNSIAVREGLRDVLYADNINPITFINGSGLMNFGNKTRSSTSSAIDRVNVSRLVSYMRRQLDLIAKPFIFEPNDELTRNEIKGVIDSFCNELLAKRAIGDYLVVCDESNNTPARIDRNELYVDVAIEPIKALEFIYIPVRLKNTGEIAAL